MKKQRKDASLTYYGVFILKTRLPFENTGDTAKMLNAQSKNSNYLFPGLKVGIVSI